MRFHKQYCGVCRTETLFLEKLVNPKDGFCKEKEDICQYCKTQFEVKDKIKINL